MSNIIIPIEEFAEILFDNSEDIPNDIYITFMDLLKQYHENENNEKEIRKFLKKVNKNIRVKLEKHLPPKQMTLHCSCDNVCVITNSCFMCCRWCFFISSVFLLFGAIIFCIASRRIGGGSFTHPPPRGN